MPAAFSALSSIDKHPSASFYVAFCNANMRGDIFKLSKYVGSYNVSSENVSVFDIEKA